MNKPLRIFLALCLLFTSILASAEPEKWLVTGTASNLTTGEIVYREYHDITPQQHTVLYKNPAGKLIATKNISYNHGFNTPEYQQNDLRFDRHTGSKWQNNHFMMFSQEKSDRAYENTVKPADDLVIDAGFDYLIRSHWDELLKGKVLPFSFAVADPLMVLSMQVEAVSASETAIRQHRSQYRYFLVSSRNHLIGWAMPDINLAYDRDSHLLQIYQGPSNITDQNDTNQTVVVRYEYQQALPAAGKVRTP
ncbi:MAG TPA: hypothetical protein VLB90_04130 [Pseudomonadales bacterium]|nr:hypothetical protein [Pseudomonadales bacterium]